MGDERLRIRDLRLGLSGLGLSDGELSLGQISSRLHGRQRRLQRFDIIRQGLWHGVHDPMES